MTTSDSRTLGLDDATIAYEIAEIPDSPHPVLLMIGQPMAADGFAALADQFTDRTVVRYDPRGIGRSTRRDGSTLNDPAVQTEDLHALAREVGGGAPVDVFASSGGAVTSLAWVATYPDDIRVLVAHEPPIMGVLPDAQFAVAAGQRNVDAYRANGFGAGMAGFIQLIMHQGEFTQEYLDRPLPDPAQFGLPTEDDGTRNDPILGGDSDPITAFEPDLDALRVATTRIVFGVGEASGDIVTARSSRVLAERLDAPVATFRGGHGGFAADEWGTPGDPALFAQQLRTVL